MLIVFGGSFDPVHIGHLRSAIELQELFGGPGHCALRLLPARQHALKGPTHASAEQRRAMLEVAVSGLPNMAVDARELSREGLSRTYDTLATIRAEEGADVPLAFAMGSDAWHSVQQWYRWLELPDLAHIIILRRPAPDSEAHVSISGSWHSRLTRDPHDLASSPCGRILPLDLVQLEISSTRIRAALARQQSVRFLLPESVIDYIQRHALYRV